MKKIFLLTATCVVVALPWSAQAWIQFLDGSTLPDVPWQSFQDMSGTGAGDTLVVDFLDPALNVTNQALRLNSGSGANEWYVGAFFDDEVVGASCDLAKF